MSPCLEELAIFVPRPSPCQAVESVEFHAQCVSPRRGTAVKDIQPDRLDAKLRHGPEPDVLALQRQTSVHPDPHCPIRTTQSIQAHLLFDAIPAIALKKRPRPAPVSYTHLDVYKRQVGNKSDPRSFSSGSATS